MYWDIRDEIRRHRDLLEMVLPQFKEFARQCPRELGLYEFPLPGLDEGYSFKSLAVEIKKSTLLRGRYDFGIGIIFVMKWDGRLISRLTPLRVKTMEDIRKLELTDKLFDVLMDDWKEQIWKFFDSPY